MGNNGFIDFNDELDPAISAVLGGGKRRQAEARLPKASRAKLTRERRKAEERKGKRVGFDLDPEVIRKVKKLAEQYETTASQVAGLALTMFLERVEAGEINLRDYQVIIDNPRYGYKLEKP